MVTVFAACVEIRLMMWLGSTGREWQWLESRLLGLGSMGDKQELDLIMVNLAWSTCWVGAGRNFCPEAKFWSG
jgi:hypothetical protein